jgi:hypothetical protein
MRVAAMTSVDEWAEHLFNKTDWLVLVCYVSYFVAFERDYDDLDYRFMLVSALLILVSKAQMGYGLIVNTTTLHR